MKLKSVCLAIVAGVFSNGSVSAAVFSPVTGTSNNDFLNYQGNTQAVSTPLTNPYSGQTVTVNGSFNVNTGNYDGLGGFDILVMTNGGDFFTLDNGMGNPLLNSIELIQAAEGPDVVNLASTSISIPDTIISGAGGRDILWGNSGNDSIAGQGDDDNVDGGPGNDQVEGNEGNDFVNGGLGADFIIGGSGNDVLNYTADGFWSGGVTAGDLGTASSALSTFNLDGYSLSQDVFDGEGDFDIIQMTSGNDTLFLFDSQNAINPNVFSGFTRVLSVEEIRAGDGDDFVDMSNGLTSTAMTLKGEGGNDILIGGLMDDALFGGADNDTLDGMAGKDFLDGDIGNDTFLLTDFAGDFILGGDGIDTLQTSLLFMDFSIQSFTFDTSDPFAMNFSALGVDGLDGFLITSLIDSKMFFASGVEFFNFGDGFTFDFASLNDVSEIPIPGALPLLLTGLAGIGFMKRRKRQAASQQK